MYLCCLHFNTFRFSDRKEKNKQKKALFFSLFNWITYMYRVIFIQFQGPPLLIYTERLLPDARFPFCGPFCFCFFAYTFLISHTLGQDLPSNSLGGFFTGEDSKKTPHVYTSFFAPAAAACGGRSRRLSPFFFRLLLSSSAVRAFVNLWSYIIMMR
jgi:hypothetical protein